VVEKDEKEAIRFYKLSAKQGNALAQYRLGCMYMDGRGMGKDKQKAIRLFKLSAEQGNGLAQFQLGSLYVMGQGVAKDEEEGVCLLKLAVDQGNASTQNSLGYMYMSGEGVGKDEEEAVRLYKLSAKQGNALAQYRLGCMYVEGRGVDKDENEAIRLYKLSAEQGNTLAQYNLGYMYMHGRGVDKDEQEGIRLYKLSAEQGNAFAQDRLGYMYMHGQGGVAKDEQEGIRLYKLSAEQGNALAQNSLGCAYMDGLEVGKGEQEAVHLFKLSADQGNGGALHNLGDAYEKGRGVEKNLQMAVGYYGASAKIKGSLQDRARAGLLRFVDFVQEEDQQDESGSEETEKLWRSFFDKTRVINKDLHEFFLRSATGSDYPETPHDIFSLKKMGLEGLYKNVMDYGAELDKWGALLIKDFPFAVTCIQSKPLLVNAGQRAVIDCKTGFFHFFLDDKIYCSMGGRASQLGSEICPFILKFDEISKDFNSISSHLSGVLQTFDELVRIHPDLKTKIKPQTKQLKEALKCNNAAHAATENTLETIKHLIIERVNYRNKAFEDENKELFQ
jgi:TPR repeat protein